MTFKEPPTKLMAHQIIQNTTLTNTKREELRSMKKKYLNGASQLILR